MARLPSPRTLRPLSWCAIFLLAFPLGLLASDEQQVNAPSPVPNPNASARDLEEQGDALRAQKRYLDALDFYSAAIAKQPTALLWNKKGMAYLFLQKYPEATKCFSRAIKADRNSPEGYNNRGYMEQRNKNYEQSHPLLQESPGLATQRCRLPLQHGKFVLLASISMIWRHSSITRPMYSTQTFSIEFRGLA